MADEKKRIDEAFLETFVQALVKHSFVGPVPQKQPKQEPEHLEKEYMPSLYAQQPPQIQPMPQTISPMHMPKRPQQQRPLDMDLGKITMFLNDPTVISVECPGPEKNIHINRAGRIQTAPIALTTEEIETIMHEISDRTRIPLTQGLFRAVMQEYLITAVISEFVGTRFIIQKRIPGVM